MNWVDEAAARLRKKNQILLGKDSPYLQDLHALFQAQSHQAVALWAFEFAAESAAQLEEKYPLERRPRQALEAAQDWAAGKVKMRWAQRKILDCHAFAKEIDRREDIAICHAIGQACAVVHTAGHAMGYPVYDLTAIIYRLGIENCVEAVERRKQAYIDRLLDWSARCGTEKREWAPFMKRQPLLSG